MACVLHRSLNRSRIQIIDDRRFVDRHDLIIGAESCPLDLAS